MVVAFSSRHLNLGSAICRRPFLFVFVACCAQRRATMLSCVAVDCLLRGVLVESKVCNVEYG